MFVYLKFSQAFVEQLFRSVFIRIEDELDGSGSSVVGILQQFLEDLIAVRISFQNTLQKCDQRRGFLTEGTP
jgi:hypothetical protein